MVSCVWPGAVYFPDFNHPGAHKYWNESLFTMRTVLHTEPSGYWIDMNEFASFIEGERSPNEECPGASPPSPPPYKKDVDDNVYLPYHVSAPFNLANKTVTLSTRHYNKKDAVLISGEEVTELYFHPLNNYGESIATHESLKSFTKSPLSFSLTRSSVYGSPRYSQHWTGDNNADWDMMRLALSEILPY